MRTFLLMITIGLGSAFANSSYAQKEIDINVNNVTIEQLFEEIQDNSEFVFFYKDKTIDPQLKVTLQMKKKTLATILNKAFYGTNLKYNIDGRQVVIKTESKPEPSATNESSIIQGFELTGTILDANGVPLPGASIIEKGTTNGTETDFDGNFSLTVNDENAILIVSYIGYTTIEQPVEGNTTISIALQEDQESLDEVVIVGYGKQKRASVTGAVASVSNEALTIAPVANVSQSLAGRLPGLISKQESGLPGNDAAALSIRGFGSPLVIVDGVPSSFDNIDSESIESITVLKDASAAVYGARAGNGVILVTTKRGTDGKTNITFKASTSFQKPADLVKMASSGQMAELSREQHTNAGQPEATQRFTQDEVDLFYAGTDPYFLPLLKDEKRSVRIKAFFAIASLDEMQIPQDYKEVYKKVKKEFDTHLSVTADFAGGRAKKGGFYLRKGNLNNAIKAFESALEIDHINNIIRSNLANLYYRNGNLLKSEEAFITIISQEPEFGQTYYSYALLLGELNRTEEAITQMELAIKYMPKNIRFYYNLSLLYDKVNNLKKAEATAVKGLKIAPQNDSLLYVLAFIYYKDNQIEKAKNIASSLVELYPNNSQYVNFYNQLR